ncbi:hypothetical protein PSTT_00110, partial [Puccinia striiformis]
MLQSLSDSLKVEAQAILDNLDPAKLTKINSFFNNCLGKISNFALQKAQHNFTQTLLELGLLAQPEHFDTQWHLRGIFLGPFGCVKHQGGLVGGLNSTEGGVGRRCGQSRNFLDCRHPKRIAGTIRRHPNFVAAGDLERRHPKTIAGTKRFGTSAPQNNCWNQTLAPNFVAEGDLERQHPKVMAGTERRQTIPPQLSLTQQSEDLVEWQLGNLKTTEKVNLDEEMEKIKTHLKSFNTPTQRETLDKIYGILDDKPHSLGKRRHPAEEPTQQNKKLMIQP